MQNVKCKMQNEDVGSGNVVLDKSFDFAVRIVNVYRFLTGERKEFVLSKQLLRSGTSIGANVSEAQCGQSRADFYAKMCIALKEASETHYRKSPTSITRQSVTASPFLWKRAKLTTG